MDRLEKLMFCFGVTSIIQANYMLVHPNNEKRQQEMGELAMKSLDRLSALVFSPKGEKILEEMQISEETHVNGLRCFILDFYDAFFVDDLPIDRALENVRKRRKEETHESP